MDQRKAQSRGSSSSSSSSSSTSFTENLFGPKDPSSATSSGLFSSVFGPSSTGLRNDSSHSKNTGATKKQEYGGPYGSGKQSTPDHKPQRYIGEKEGNPIYQNETAEPSYLSSSIYYGGQEVYSPNNSQPCRPHHTFKKDGGDEDPNNSSASRGNWWQGSLYY